MNQLKPFLFWIIAGAVLVLLLAYWLLSIPAIGLVGNKAEAQEVKNNLDKEYKHLAELDAKAKKGSPTGTFNAESEDDIRKLTSTFLIAPGWKSELEPVVRRYEEQLKTTKEHLVGRSKSLHAPIATTTELFGWYTAYQTATEAELAKLHAAQALVVPAAASTTTDQKSDEQEALDFAGNSAVRVVAGFYTKGADLPAASEFPALTARFRIMQRIIAVVLATTAAPAVNPLALAAEAGEPAHARIAGVAWGDDDANLGTEVGSYARGWRLSLTLEGASAAILRTMAALEAPTDEHSPLIAITATTFGRKSAYTPGERKDADAEPVVATLSVLVLDFSEAVTGRTPSTGGSKNPLPGGAGAPGGISGGPGGMMPPGMMVPPGMQAPAAAPKAPKSKPADAAAGDEP